MRTISFVLCLAFIIPLYATDGYAGAGDLDLTFGDGGKVSTDFPLRFGVDGNAIAVQADGKILVAGGELQHFVVARFNADGTPDTGFGDNGITKTFFGTSRALTTSVGTQRDGKIILGGMVRHGGGGAGAPDMVLARYDQNGSLDPTFGENGVVITNFSSIDGENSSDTVRAVFVQPGGRILAVATVGYSVNPTQGAGIVAFLPDGRIDSSYGRAGKVFIAPEDFLEDANWIYRIPVGYAMRPDGRLVLLFRPWVNKTDPLKRTLWVGLDPQGNLDAGFGDGGVAQSPDMWGEFMTLAGDGSILTHGTVYLEGDPIAHYAMERRNPDGSLDTGFGENGVALIPSTSVTADILYWLVDMIVLDDGGIVALGSEPGYDYREDGTSYYRMDFAALGLNADGTLNQNFGEGGVMRFPFGTGPREARPSQIVALDETRFAMVGTYEHYPVGGDYTIALLKRNAAAAVASNAGVPDAGFGMNGKALFEITVSGPEDGALSSVVQPDGKIVVAGVALSSTPREGLNFLVARYLEDGRLDSSFGDAGFVSTDVRSYRNPDPPYDYEEYDEGAQAVALQPDGKIVVGGYSQTWIDSWYGDRPYVSFALVRYLPDGSLDPAFGDNGAVVTDFATDVDDLPPNAFVEDILIQENGKIVAVGSAQDRPNAGPYEWSFALARFNADGSVDGSFGDNGQVKLDSLKVGALNGYHSMALASALQQDGKIVVGGRRVNRSIWDETGSGFLIFRLNGNGSLDQTFGAGGMVADDIDQGLHRPFGMSDWGFDDTVYDILVRPDGRIVAGGSAFMGDSSWDMVVTQYLQDGARDPAFGDNGLRIWDFNRDLDGVLPAGADEITGLALQEDGRVVAAGHSGRWGQAPRGKRWRHTYYAGHVSTLMRIEPDGRLDYLFGDGGKSTISFDYSIFSIAEDVNLLPDGDIVTTGYAYYSHDLYDCYTGNPLDCPLEVWTDITSSESNIVLARTEGISDSFDGVEALIRQIQDLATSDQLIAGQATSLQSKLRGVLQQMDRGNSSAAVRLMNAFIAEVNTLAETGSLDQGTADYLVLQAQEILGHLYS